MRNIMNFFITHFFPQQCLTLRSSSLFFVCFLLLLFFNINVLQRSITVTLVGQLVPSIIFFFLNILFASLHFDVKWYGEAVFAVERDHFFNNYLITNCQYLSLPGHVVFDLANVHAFAVAVKNITREKKCLIYSKVINQKRPKNTLSLSLHWKIFFSALFARVSRGLCLSIFFFNYIHTK